MPHPVRDDIVGGLVSAAVAIPLAMGFGMFAFVSLGDRFFANGALAGLYTAFFVAIVAVLLGDRGARVYAPRINSTFFIGALLYGLVHSDSVVTRSASLSLTLMVFLSIILLGGVFQALFGVIKVGTLIKFAPHPVMAGFQNTAAALLFLVQLADICGFDESRPFTFVLTHLGAAKPLSLLLAAFTFAVMWNSRKISRRIPPVLVGLAFGLAAYYALLALGLGAYLGPTIGNTMPVTLSPAPWANIGDPTQAGPFFEHWPMILGGGLALAIVASMDALLCARLLRQPGDAKVDADPLLVRLGIGNVAAACFGGITGGINIGASLTNRAFGGRTRLSVLVNAAAILLAFTVLFPIVSHLPRVVLSAVIMVIAVQHLDPWSLQLVRRIATDPVGQRRFLLLDLFVVVVVAVLSITLNIVVAVFLGVIIAGGLFVVRMSRSIIRRSYRCDVISSRKSRDAREMQALERCASAILVIELQGALFFGTGERLADELDAAMQRETSCLILDLRRVSEIDSTGAEIILDIQADLTRKGGRLAFALADRSDIAARLGDFGVLDKASPAEVFEDVDRAIEWAEDELLRAELEETQAPGEMPLDQVDILHDLDPNEIEAIKAHLTRVAHPEGTEIFRQGDVGTELFILTRGTASAYIDQPGGGRLRLMTFAAGTVFGELAILDTGPRSASVIADDDLVAYVLTRADFAELSRKAPAIAIKVLASLGGELSARLRRANKIIVQLEE